MGLEPQQEKAILEALSTALADKAGLGVPKTEGDASNNSAAHHENFKNAFKLKIVNLGHYDGIAAAHTKIFDHYPANDPGFESSFLGEMKSQGIPDEEQQKAVDAHYAVLKKLGTESGFNPNLDEVVEVSQPEQYK